MEFLNSFSSVIVFLLVLAGYVWFKECQGQDQKCEYCKTGDMVEVEAKPLQAVDGGMHQDASLAKTLTEVKFQCTNCEEFWVTTITR